VYLRDAVHEGATSGDRVRRIESVLRATLVETRRAPRFIEEAVHLTLASCGRLGVDALAHRCGITARHLERQYLDAIGLPPKTFARTIRFQKALRELQRGAPAAIAAVNSGFADQSHLAREFRRFAGVSAGCVHIADVAFLQDAGVSRSAD